MANSFTLVILVALGAILAHPASAAADYPSAGNGMLGVVDIPSSSKPHPVPTPRGLEIGAPWTIICYDYPGYRVKELIGDGKGFTVASAEALSGGRPPACGAQDDPGERVLAKGLSLMGARGGFVIFTETDGPTYFFFDAASGKQVYKDEIESERISSFQVTGEVVTMSYVRHVSGPCPLLTGGAACWQRFVREARLPAEVARMGPPPATCEMSSRASAIALSVKREDYNVLTYAATVTFDRGGHSAVLSRADLGCSFNP